MPKNKAKKKLNLLNCYTDNDTLNKISGASIEIIGNSHLSIDGCMGVLEYDSECINLRLKKGTLFISGTNFDITCFENQMITINGKISSLEFSD